MRRIARVIAGLGLIVAVQVAAQTPVAAPADDPYIWLEDKDGARAMAWVEAENARTLKALKDDPHYAGFYQDAYAIEGATDRIPTPALINGRVLNFWRDDAHPHGVLRATTIADFTTPTPRWTTLLDVDALRKAEGKNWIWKGYTCLRPEERLCLISLSEGGEDAVTVREFDLATGAFVLGGFELPRSKQIVRWLDENTLLAARDWGAGTMTVSGYPFVVKRVTRGAALNEAREVYRGSTTDQLNTVPWVLTDGQGHKISLIDRGTTFFGHDVLAVTARGAVKLPIPRKVDILTMVDGQVVFKTYEDWATSDATIPAGALVSVDYRQLTGGPITPEVIFQPNARQSIETAAATRSKLVASILDNVRGRAVIFSHDQGRWTAQTVTLPDNASILINDTTNRGDEAYLTVTSFLEPTTLWSLDAVSGTARRVKALPAEFDASRAVAEQFEARSTDGTRIPYFIVHRKDVKPDGSTPTIMTAYGGFGASETPDYLGVTGKLWLERGGSFVVANIRGGGEFGPAWHEAGLKTKRQIVYDDFAAVAKDIFARKLSSPRRFGIVGGSNGGLLMGVEFNQHPELWHAVVIQVPLLDMMRYEQIEAGASWVDEYGSVSVPAERAFLAKISPYANIRRGGDYPEPFIWTTTKDDRVGPQHARKFAARLKEYGLPYLFYEDTAGGHGSNADIAQSARVQSFEMVYFTQRLMDDANDQSKR